MRETEYRQWLALQGREPSTQNTSVSVVRRIETAYGDLEQEFALSGLESIFAELAYSKSDQKNNEPNPSKVLIDGDIYNGLSSVRTHLNYYRRFLDSLSTKAAVAEVVASTTATPQGSADLSDTDQPEAVLSLEKDLNAALRQNIVQIEPGLIVIDGGKERTAASGRIDILAQDAQGRKLVIELKAVKAPRDAVAQVLAYMGDIQAESGGEVRGLLIAPDFDPRAVSAARMVPLLQLQRFSFVFAFQPVGSKA